MAPGIIDTDMNKNLSKEEIQDLEKEIPLGKMGKTEDIANIVKAIIENKYITGQVITVDRRMDNIGKDKIKNNFHLQKLFFILLII